MFCHRILPLLLLVVSTLGSTARYYDLVGAKFLTDSIRNDVSSQPAVTQKVKKEFIVNAPDSIDYREKHLVTETIEGLRAKLTGELKELSVDPIFKINISRNYPIDVMRALVHLDRFPVKVKRAILQETPNVESMKGALAQNGAPLAIMMYMSPEMLEFKGRKVLTPSDCKSQEPSHSGLLVGYGEENGKTYWIIKNALGTIYGDNGYLYLDVQSPCSVLKNGAVTAEIQV